MSATGSIGRIDNPASDTGVDIRLPYRQLLALFRKIPSLKEDISCIPRKLNKVILPWRGVTYRISFGGRPPKEVYMPQSRTFDIMLELSGTIDYNLTTEDEFLHAVVDTMDPVTPTDIYIIKYLDMYKTLWHFEFQSREFTFETIGSIFHGSLKVDYGKAEYETTCHIVSNRLYPGICSMIRMTTTDTPHLK